MENADMSDARCMKATLSVSQVTLAIEEVNRIRNKISMDTALVSSPQNIASLAEDYASDRVYSGKIDSLSRQMKCLRKVRPDGNCFYRAYLFGIFEQAITDHLHSIEQLSRKFESLALMCKEAGYDAFAIDDFHDMIRDQLEVLKTNPSEETIESTIFSDPSVDGYLIAFIRCCCGAFMKLNPEEFQAFLPSGFNTVDSFVRSEVDPMFKDCDVIQVVACTKAFEVPVKIVYLDRSDGDLVIHSFGGEDNENSVYMLYRPGHYDLIYS